MQYLALRAKKTSPVQQIGLVQHTCARVAVGAEAKTVLECDMLLHCAVVEQERQL